MPFVSFTAEYVMSSVGSKSSASPGASLTVRTPFTVIEKVPDVGIMSLMEPVVAVLSDAVAKCHRVGFKRRKTRHFRTARGEASTCTSPDALLHAAGVPGRRHKTAHRETLKDAKFSSFVRLGSLFRVSVLNFGGRLRSSAMALFSYR